MNQLALAFAAVGMLGTATAPIALGHGDSGQHLQGADLLAPSGWASEGSSTPAGWYFGSVSFWGDLETGILVPGPDSVPVLGGEVVSKCGAVESLLERVFYENRAYCIGALADFHAAWHVSKCDFEVGGDGFGPSGQDESIIDGYEIPGGSYVPDGTFNDGGLGAVCHTHAGYYGYAPYNTNGCPAGTAYAEDALYGGNVWIRTTCDSTTPVATSPVLLHVLSLEACAYGRISGGQLGLVASECLQRFVNCSLGDGACPASWSDARACVADGFPDVNTVNNGFGGDGVPYPGVDPVCAGLGTDSQQAVFVYDSVIATVTPGGVDAVNAAKATYGWVK